MQYRARPLWVEGGEHNNLEAILRCVRTPACVGAYGPPTLTQITRIPIP